MSDYLRWLRADPELVGRVTVALTEDGAFRDDSSDLRVAVARWQKRRGQTPTGWLGPDALAEILAGGDAEPRHAADDNQGEGEGDVSQGD